MTSDKRYQRWVEWLEVVRNETLSLFLNRDYWNGLGEMTRNNDLPESSFFPALSRWYVTTQAVAIRRQVDTRRDVVSLLRLIKDVAAHPDVMTRERHVALWGDDSDLQHEGHRNFDRLSGGADRIPKRAMRADSDRLIETSRPVEVLVNEAYAHRRERPRNEKVTYAQLNAAIDVIGELLRKYTSLIRASAFATLVPVDQGDWKAAFRVPWLRE